MNDDEAFPKAVHPEKVGSYEARAKAGGGYVWDEVLEYRIWCSPQLGADDLEDGSDYYYAFATYEEALAYSKKIKGSKTPLALILQREYLDEPSDGVYKHVRQERIAEWHVTLLKRPRRTDTTIPDFLSPDAPENRLEIIRGHGPRHKMDRD